jgi:beta-ribofuranosylaminobenzene 5'-phosphate synthase
VALSIVEAALLLNEVAIDDELVRRISGRGGASGVGLHSYFQGGLSLDIGRQRTSGKFESSDTQNGKFALPLTVCATSTPSWPAVLVMPKEPIAVDLKKEAEFFELNTPLDDASVYEAVYTALFGVFGGAVSGDFSSFCRALTRLQELPWKAAETALHGVAFGETVQFIRCRPEVAVIMSSLGPTLACFSPNSLTLAEELSATLPDFSVLLANPRNVGREVLNA